jgi:hypothetical protein
VTWKTASALRCSNAANCAAYPSLGEPTKLSRSNSGPQCFACEERRIAAELEATAGTLGADQRRKVNRPRLSEHQGARGRLCAEHSCARPAVEREGATFLCGDHAAVSRAAAICARRRAWVRSCEWALRSAIAWGDEDLERKWARLLLEAEARLAWAEEDVAHAERSAQSEHTSRNR